MISRWKRHLPQAGPMRLLTTGPVLLLSLTGSLGSAAVIDLGNPDFTPTNGAPTQTQVNVASGPTFANGADIGPWTTSGFVLLFGPNGNSQSGTSADLPPGAPNHFSPTGGFCLYGPSAGGCGGASANGLTIGPNGGNFLALDGALSDPSGVALRGSISQTLTGLQVGLPVTVELNWAAGQQAGFTGSTTEQLQVSLGGQTQSTQTVTNPQGGFVNWMHEEFTFVPTMSTEALSFLAIGTPEQGVGMGGPPFVLLDGGVVATEIPEPSTGTMWILGFAGLAYVGFRSKRAHRARKPV